MAGEFVAGAIVSKLLLDTKKWSTSVSKVNADQKAMQGMSEKTSKRFQMVGKSMAIAGGLITGGMGKAVAVFGDFDQAMTESLSIMGDVSEGLRTEMKNAAIEMSTESTFAAKELGAAYFYLASAGLDAEKSISALPIVTRFAQAGAFDLASATDLLTDAQSALGLSVDDVVQNETNMIAVSDVLVKSNTLANAAVSEFSEALTNKAGAAMRAYGIELETGVAVLAAFADQGTKGSDAGTQFSIVLRELQKAAIQNKGAFEKAGVAVFDATGDLTNIGEIVGQLEDRFRTMSPEQKKVEMGMLGFSEKSQMALLTLIGTSEKIKDYETSLRSAGGITQEVSDNQLKSFNAQMTIAKNKVTASAIAIGEQLAPIVVQIAEKFSNVISKISDFAKANPALFGTITKLVAGAGALMTVFGTVLMILPRMILNFKLLRMQMPKTTSAFGKLGAVATAAFIGWEIGKRIGEMKILGKSINEHVVTAFGSLTDKIMGLGKETEMGVGHAAALAKQEKMLADASALAGKEITNVHDAIDILNGEIPFSEANLKKMVVAEKEATDQSDDFDVSLNTIKTTIQSLDEPFTGAEQQVFDLASAFSSGSISMSEYHEELIKLKAGITEVFDPDEYEMAEMNAEVDILMANIKSQPDALASVLDQAGIKIAGINQDLIEDVKTTAGETTTIWGEAADGLVTKWSGMIGEWVASGDLFKGDFKGLADSMVSIMTDTAGQLLSTFVSGFIKKAISGVGELAGSIGSEIGKAFGGEGATSVVGGLTGVVSQVGSLVSPIGQIAGAVGGLANLAASLFGGKTDTTERWFQEKTWEAVKEARDWHFINHQARLDEMTKALTGTIPVKMDQSRILIRNFIGNKYLRNIEGLTKVVAKNTSGILKKTGKAQTGAIHMSPGLFAVGEDAPRIPEITAPIASLARLFGGGGGSRTQLFLTVNNETQEIDLNEGVQEIMITATPELTRQGRMKVNTNALVKER